jgi:hypothetical protein
VKVDPLASMRCWAIEIELGGRTYDVPALPAVDWWPVLTERNLGGILDFVVSSPEDPSNLDDLLLTGALEAAELGEALTHALEAAAGRSLHSAFILALVADMHWATIGGALAQSGFRWDIQSLSAALDAIYAVLVSSLGKEDLEKFTALLDDERLSDPTKKRAPSEKVVSEFESLAGPRPTSGVKATAEQSGSSRPRIRQRPRPPRPVAQSGAPRPRRGGRAGSGPEASS